MHDAPATHDAVDHARGLDAPLGVEAVAPYEPEMLDVVLSDLIQFRETRFRHNRDMVAYSCDLSVFALIIGVSTADVPP